MHKASSTRELKNEDILLCQDQLKEQEYEYPRANLEELVSNAKPVKHKLKELGDT